MGRRDAEPPVTEDDDVRSRAPRSRWSSRLDLVLTWALAVAGVVAVLGCALFVFDLNLRAYAMCWEFPRTGCSDTGWFVSEGLTSFGGIAAVSVGAVVGIRRSQQGRTGAWSPVLGIAAVVALTALAVLVLRLTTSA